METSDTSLSVNHTELLTKQHLCACLGADTGATDRNDIWVLAVLLQLPIVTSWSGHRSNGTEPLLGPGSPPSASRCHVLERTREQRNGTTPGSWQSSLSSFSFPLSRLGADTGATERNHSWVPDNGKLTQESSTLLSSKTSRLGKRTQEQRNGTCLGPGSGSVPFSCVPPRRDNGKLKEGEDCQDPGVVPFRCSLAPSVTQEQRNGTTAWVLAVVPFRCSCVSSKT